MTDRTVILSFMDYREQAKKLADISGLDYAEIAIHRFPDGESKLLLPEKLPSKVIFCRSLNDPNSKLIELFLAAGSARDNGVDTLVLVAPYLCYMRQDKAFHPGEVVSQKIVGKLLAQTFDVVITVDAHLHRIHELSEAIPINHAVNLTATEPMAEFLQTALSNPLLLGPDSESEQWVAAIAAKKGLDYAVASKQRLGDRDVLVELPDTNYEQRDIVLVDDVASTGKTLLAVTEKLKQHSPASISVLVNHAMFVNDAIEQLQRAGVSHIWSCDSIPHTTNRISLAPLLYESLKQFVDS